MKALITGAAGFVGRHLANHLLDMKWDVSATRLPVETAAISGPVYELDILEPQAIKDLLDKIKPDYIFHLVAQSSVALSWKQPALTIDVNIKGAANLLEAVRNMKKPPRVLLIGSGEEYGHVSPEELPIKEDTPLRPGNIYAGTKAAQGMLGQIYAQAYGLDIIIVRSFNNIGPGQSDAFVLPNFCKQVAMIEADFCDPVINVGNLDVRRDFTDVRDIVRAYRLLIEKGVSGMVYNVGSGKAVSIREVLDIILSLTKKKIKVEQVSDRLRPSDTAIVESDISRLCALTEWKPEISIETTVSDILGEWREKIISHGGEH